MKQENKMLIFLLAVILAVSFSTVSALAKEDAGPQADTVSSSSGSCGDNLTWTLSDDGVLTISGTGDMWDYPSEQPGFYNFRENIKSCVIGEGVTGIGAYAFYNLTALTSVTIPDTVTSIERYAFEYCKSLTSVTIPFSVTGVGYRAFYSCTSLTSIIFKGGAPEFGNEVFYNVTATVHYLPVESWDSAAGQNYGGTLTWVCDNKCGDNVTWFLSSGGVLTISGTGVMWDYWDYWEEYQGYYDFRESIISCVIRDGVTGIGEYAFYNLTSLTGITIPNSVTEIVYGAFVGCTSLTGITIPDSVTEIGSSAFNSCTSLTSVTIPESVKEIGSDAFRYCSSLTGVTIGSGVLEIGNTAFGYCTSLADVSFKGSAPTFGSNVFCNDTATVYYLPVEKFGWTSDVMKDYGGTLTWVCDNKCGDNVTWYLSSDGTLKISGTGDMWNIYPYYPGYSSVREDITSVIIENGVTGIMNYAFEKCKSLISVTIPDSVTDIGICAFADCTSLTDVTIPNSVTGIRYGVFRSCTSLTNITIPDNVTSIGDYAFYKCTSLTSVTIPENVTAIWPGAFSSCTALKSITFKGSAPEFGNDVFSDVTATAYYLPVESFGWTSDVMKNYGGNLTWICDNKCGDNVTWYLSSDGVLTFSGTGVTWDFNSKHPGYYSVRESITSCVIKDGVTGIGPYGLCDIRSLTSVSIPDTLTSIGAGAFFYCSSLSDMTIPQNVTSIGSRAFEHCTSLTDVMIGSSVTSIEDRAFDTCQSLTKVTFKGSAPAFGNNVFYKVTATAYYLPVEKFGWTSDVMQNYGGNLTWVCDNKCGDNVTWYLSSDGTLKISGIGNMWDCTTDHPGYYSIPQYITSCVIGSGVTSIGDYALSYLNFMTNITLPNSIIRIGKGAFYYCIGLKNVTIPDNVTAIEDYTFQRCYYLTNVTIPDSVTTIGNYAFSYCHRLESIIIPHSVMSIGIRVFELCNSLTSVIIPDSVTTIGEYAFSNCKLLTSMTIGSGVTHIGTNAFEKCESLNSITFRGSAPMFGSTVFYKVTATAYYPANDDTWTESVRQDYGGHITWVMKEIYSLSEKTLDIVVGGSGDLSVLSSSGATVAEAVWESSNEEVASINGNGTITANKVGKAIITARYGDFEDSCEVQVQFTDVINKKKFYYYPVYWAFENNITTGTSPEKFSPDDICTRGQIVTFLWRLVGSPEPTTTTSPFKDVKQGKFYYKAVLWAVENGITTGAGEKDKNGNFITFLPNDNCTRGQCVTFLWRALGSPEPKTSSCPFTDVKSGKFYYKAVLWAVENNITTGTSTTTFSPNEDCTRGHIVTFLYRYDALK